MPSRRSSIMSIGMTLAVAPLTSTVLAAVEKHQTGMASGFNSAVARLGGLIVVALLGAVLMGQGDALLGPFAKALIAMGIVAALGGVAAFFGLAGNGCVRNREAIEPSALTGVELRNRQEPPDARIRPRPLAERIARVLAGIALSSNAEGSDPSAGAKVDVAWPQHMNQALAVLHTMREPDEAKAAVGDLEPGEGWSKQRSLTRPIRRRFERPAGPPKFVSS